MNVYIKTTNDRCLINIQITLIYPNLINILSILSKLNGKVHFLTLKDAVDSFA